MILAEVRDINGPENHVNSLPNAPTCGQSKLFGHLSTLLGSKMFEQATCTK